MNPQPALRKTHSILSWRLYKLSMLNLHRLFALLLAAVLLLLPLTTQGQVRSRLAATRTSVDAKPRVSGGAQDSRLINSDQATVGNGAVSPKTVTGQVSTSPPQMTQEQQELRERMINEVNRSVPFPRVHSQQAASPAVTSEDPATPAPQQGSAPQIPNDFVITNIHDITSSEVATSQRSVIHEPSVGNMGSTIFYSANWYAARSTDGGQTFGYVNPYTTFPSINNGFCCDQIVNYSPPQNMMIWALQYVKDSTSGTLRIARAVGGQVANNTWAYYDFNPQIFGFASGNWMDFPNLTVGATFLYVTSNVFRTSDNVFTGSVIFRIPLSELAAGGTVNFSYFARTDVGSLRCVEGAGATMYWADHLSSTTIRIFRWADNSGTIFWDDVGINAFTFLNRDGVATSPDGTNWAARGDSRILGAFLRNGVLGFMWMAKQNGSTRPYPYTIVAQFNESTRAFISQEDIWNNTFAWLYPSITVNAAGNMGGIIGYGGGSFYPNTAVWLVDDVTTTVVPFVSFIGAFSNDGPDSNTWGDFLTVRRHKSDPNTYVAGIYYLNGGGAGSFVVPRYLRFGRERDFSVCGGSYSIFPSNQSFGAGGGVGSVSITTTESCNWGAISNAGWITITNGITGSGNNFVAYSVAPNTGAARSGTLIIAGQIFTVAQDAGCSFTISPGSQNFTISGGPGSINVTGVAGCGWSAVSNAAWITINSGSSGNGNGVVSYSVAANAGGPRVGTVTVAGQIFILTQDGAGGGGGGGGLKFYLLARPIRLLETRPGEVGCFAPGVPLSAGGVRNQQARITCNGVTIPANAQAIIGNATVVNVLPGSQGGYITLYPGGVPQPTVSNLNYVSGQIIPNSFVVGLGSDGTFNIFALTSTHFIVDVTGYFAP